MPIRTGVPALDEDFDEAAHTFSLLASPVRVRLLWELCREEADVSQLAEATGVTLATASHHLNKMRLARMVSSRSEGRRQVYRLDDPHIAELVGQALDHHVDLRTR